MATHSSILAWRIPWTEEPGKIQSIRSHRIRHDWSNLACTHDLCYNRWGYLKAQHYKNYFLKWQSFLQLYWARRGEQLSSGDQTPVNNRNLLPFLLSFCLLLLRRKWLRGTLPTWSTYYRSGTMQNKTMRGDLEQIICSQIKSRQREDTVEAERNQ